MKNTTAPSILQAAAELAAKAQEQEFREAVFKELGAEPDGSTRDEISEISEEIGIDELVVRRALNAVPTTSIQQLKAPAPLPLPGEEYGHFYNRHARRRAAVLQRRAKKKSRR